MNAITPEQLKARNRGRWTLVALFGLFFGATALAGLLRFSGWQPTAHRNTGQMIEPHLDVRALPPTLASGQPYPWKSDSQVWRILVAPAPGCAAECVTLSQDLAKVWQLFGHRADNVEILWLGTPPAEVQGLPALRALQPQPELRAVLPGVDDATGTPVYVVDPNGFVLMRYAPGFELAGLRKDMATLLKLK